MNKIRLMCTMMALACLVFVSPGCYTLVSASIPIEMKTLHVDFFENNAALVVPYHSQQFTEALKDRIRTTSRLSIVAGEGDASMSGTISDYRIAPVSIQATNNNVAPIAGASVLTITVKVTFTCNVCKDKKINFVDQTFTKTQNYTGDIGTQEQALITAIDKQIIDDIFNKAFNNW